MFTAFFTIFTELKLSALFIPSPPNSVVSTFTFSASEKYDHEFLFRHLATSRNLDIKKQAWRDSNPQPSDLESDALAN